MHLANSVLLTICMCLAVNTVSAYEILFNVGTNRKASVVHKVPVLHNREGVLERGNILLLGSSSLSDKLWIRNINGLGTALFQFKDGRLERFFRETEDSAKKEKDERYLCESPENPTQMADLWRKPSTGDTEAWDYWARSSRIRLWFFNPNAAGTLFAEIALVLASLALLIFRRKLICILLGCAAVVPVAFLVLTGSRGSFIALAVGGLAIAVMYFVLRRVGWKVLAVAGFAVLSLFGALALGLGGKRFGKELVAVDSGNVQRLRAWGAAPAMMAAAPRGWGEKCGHAYNEWFQREEDTHVLSYLVNTHLTWMAKKGWVFSFFYVLGWSLLFLQFLAHINERWNVLAFGMWSLFFVANWFSTLGFFFSLWIIPVLCTVPAFVQWGRSAKRDWKVYVVLCLVAPLISFGTVWGMVAVGRAELAKMDVPVRHDGKAVYVGKGDPVAYVVPDYWVLCRYRYGGMGRDIRAWCKAHEGEGSIVVVDSIANLPTKIDRLVLIGRSCREYMGRMKIAVKNKSVATGLSVAKHLVFVSPNLTIRKLSRKLADALHLKVFTGEFLADVTGDTNFKSPWLNIIPKCELYLPNWLELAVKGGVK